MLTSLRIKEDRLESSLLTCHHHQVCIGGLKTTTVPGTSTITACAASITKPAAGKHHSKA
jgi:hypothetical protein